jgi:outer membrane biosynthesis protein TonB
MLGANDDRSSDLLIRALILSLLLHLVAYSTFRVGQNQGWWHNMTMPRWMQRVSQVLMPVAPKKPSPVLSPQTLLAFVEVDPSLATPEPPTTPKFVGAKNTQAANKEIKVPSDKPNIEGREKEYLKTTTYAKAAEPKPAPQPAPPQRPTQAQDTANGGAPKKTYAPGDLAMVRPEDKAREGKSDTPSADQTQTQPGPAPVPDRPRTLAEARERRGLHGDPSRQEGGVRHIAAETSLDVKGTPFGDYLDQLVRAVDSRWQDLLQNQTAASYGKVVLQFRLHSDGRVSELTMVKNEVSDTLEFFCEKAIRDPSPYHRWPTEMLRDLGNDHYDITFTFYYE